VLTPLLHGLLSLHGWPAYLIVGLLCFGEAAFFLGFVLPGEVAVVYGGVLASLHHVSLVWMCVLVVGAAVLGDTVGFEVGRHLGPWLLRHWPLNRTKGVDRTRAFLKRRGGPAVFFGRFVSVLRALVPGVAGVSELRYRTFLLYNALGGLVWGLGFTFAGYLAGRSYERVLSAVGRTGTYVLLGVVVAGAGVLLWRRVRRHRRSVGEEQETARTGSSKT
jgi:membrane-associated protein